MAVVINDFEVVSEGQPGGGATRSVNADEPAGAQGGGGGTAAPGLTPNDIRRVLRREEERTERVRAH
jgi:hypothetical protein